MPMVRLRSPPTGWARTRRPLQKVDGGNLPVAHAAYLSNEGPLGSLTCPDAYRTTLLGSARCSKGSLSHTGECYPVQVGASSADPVIPASVTQLSQV
jgi:hypothetical protein